MCWLEVSGVRMSDWYAATNTDGHTIHISNLVLKRLTAHEVHYVYTILFPNR